MPKYHLEPVTAPEIPKDFHLKLRKRFLNALKEQNSHNQNFSASACLFKGIPTVRRNYDDIDEVVDQESTFWYLFGVKQADCYALIENQSGKTTIFVPKFDENYKMWMYIKPNEIFKEQSQAEQVLYTEEIEGYMQSLNLKQIYLYYGVDSDSGIEVALPQEKYWNFGPKIDKQTLWVLISNLRVIKTQDEINIMRYVCHTSTEAHISAIKSTRAGLKQAQLQGVFEFEHTIKTGSKKTGFHGICSSGMDCATLHYIENDKIYEPGQMALHDMGGKFYGYCADQAVTFPVDGKFTQKQKQIYNAVYEAQQAVLKVLKPGVNWEDMHLLAQRVINEHLIEIGIINKFPMEELIEKRVGAVFFPHGLGHFLGLKTHDVGGYTKGPQRSTLAGLKSLRTRRVMQEGMVITVEPGCYFIDFIIKKALQGENAKYFNQEKIKEYQHVGGVRLEDDVLITKDGNEVLSHLPRHWQELEKLLAE